MIQWLFLFIVLLSSIAQATLTLWTPHLQSTVYVLPEGLTPESYLESLRSNKDLRHFTQYMKVTPRDRIEVIHADSISKRERALMLANSPLDHSLHHPRLSEFGDHFSKAYVLPVGATLNMKPSDRESFHGELGAHFGLLIAMGGDDVDPFLYKEKATWALDFNRTRDLLEIAVIKHFYHKTDNKIFGVCRGLQLTSVALGAKLVQDNVLDLNISENHKHGNYHPIIFGETHHNTYKKIMRLTKMSAVNSYHHQSVSEASISNTVLQVAARSPEGVVEALESKDNRVLLVQSHPEKDDNSHKFMNIFFTELKKWALFPEAKSCRQVLSLTSVN